MKILLMDNYDSFTYNLVHYLQIAGAQVDVCYNNNAIFKNKITNYHALVLSPGPNEPLQSGLLMQSIALNTHLPILGVCLGMQAIGLHYGAILQHAPLPVHGKPSSIELIPHRLWQGITNPMQVGRYHSLALTQLPNSLQLIAQCNSICMAIAHTQLPIVGVQFHPESILTPQGQQFITNWVNSILPLN